MIKKNIYISISIIIAVSLIGCGKSKYEIQQEKRQLQKIQIEEKNIALWIKNGYTKQDALSWKKYDMLYNEAKTWIKIGINNPLIAFQWSRKTLYHAIMKPSQAQGLIQLGLDVKTLMKWHTSKISKNDPKSIKYWLDIGITEPSVADSWYTIGKTPQEVKKWMDLSIGIDIAKNLNYDTFTNNSQKYNISTKEYLAWIQLGESNLEVINFLKQKKYFVSKITEPSLELLLNNMSNENFYNMMGLTDIRLINGYNFHWKYTSNYTRFYKILDVHYGINLKEKLRSFE